MEKNNPFKDIFMETEDCKFIVKAPLIRVELPIEFFERGISDIIGSDIETIGIFNFYTYGEGEDNYNEETERKPNKYLLKMPAIIHMCPTTITQKRNEETQRLVNVLEFVQGDMFIKSTNITKTWKTVNKILNLLISGFIPDELGYDEILDFMLDACRINDAGLNVVDTVLELMISELNRSPYDISKPFRVLINENPKVKMTNRRSIKMDELGRLNNTFAAISSADAKQGITMSVSRTRNKEPQKESSVEKVITEV